MLMCNVHLTSKDENWGAIYKTRPPEDFLKKWPYTIKNDDTRPDISSFLWFFKAYYGEKMFSAAYRFVFWDKICVTNYGFSPMAKLYPLKSPSSSNQYLIQ